MFKAALISDPAYYRLRRRQMLLALLPAFPLALIVSHFELPLWIPVLAFALYVLALVWAFKNQNALARLKAQRRIEIDEREIRILTSDGQLVESISLDQVDQLRLKDNYGFAQETLGDLARELQGDAKKNYLIVDIAGRQRRFDFEIDSYYGITQLEKVIARWSERGYPVESV